MASKKSGMKTPQNQATNFQNAAREAECDEDAARFEDRLKRVVKSTPAKETKKPAK